MSEYLNKKAVLEWLKQEQRDEGWLEQTKHGFFWVEREIESGAFDAEQTCTQENPCPECLKKSVDGYKLIESELNTELQRLRAALEMAKSELRWGDPTNAIERVERIIDEALSTTTGTEPTGAERVREVVAWFAQQMEAKLRENDHKGGWENCSLDWLVGRLYREAKELWIEVDRVDTEPKRIIREAADVANFAMMIADIARRINAKEKVGTEEWRHKYFGAEWTKVEGDGNDA